MAWLHAIKVIGVGIQRRASPFLRPNLRWIVVQTSNDLPQTFCMQPYVWYVQLYWKYSYLYLEKMYLSIAWLWVVGLKFVSIIFGSSAALIHEPPLGTSCSRRKKCHFNHTCTSQKTYKIAPFCYIYDSPKMFCYSFTGCLKLQMTLKCKMPKILTS